MSSDTDQKHDLCRHLETLCDSQDPEARAADIAEGIIDDPQEHLEALEQAGVVECCWGLWRLVTDDPASVRRPDAAAAVGDFWRPLAHAVIDDEGANVVAPDPPDDTFTVVVYKPDHDDDDGFGVRRYTNAFVVSEPAERGDGSLVIETRTATAVWLAGSFNRYEMEWDNA